MNLAFSEATDQLVDMKIIKRLSDFKHIIIFGAGDSGGWVLNLLGMYNVIPCCFCDNYQKKWGTMKDGYPVMSFDSAIKKYPDAAICVASMWYEEILRQISKYDVNLMDRTWNLLTTMAWETTNRVCISSEKEYIEKHLKEFERLEQIFSDDYSRKTLEGILNFRLTRNIGYIKEVKSNALTYLDSDVLKEKGLCKISESAIVDGGAFDGDTIRYLIKNLGKRKSLKIHAYEIEKENCLKIESEVSDFYPHEIIVHMSALWDKSEKFLVLSGDGLSCQVSENKKTDLNQVRTECIDDLDEKIGFIKLDIEGAEREALLGAQKTIKRYRPVLAVCAYHLQDDLLKLTSIIESMECGYKMYLRHYMCSAGDTVLYAVAE